MASVVKISEAAALALHAMAYLAAQPETLVSTKKIAQRLRASEAHLSKVMQRMVHAGFVRSIPGPHGGFALVREPGDISLRDVFEAMEGRLASEACMFAGPVCGSRTCIMGEVMKPALKRLHDYLRDRSLADVAQVLAKRARKRR